MFLVGIEDHLSRYNKGVIMAQGIKLFSCQLIILIITILVFDLSFTVSASEPEFQEVHLGYLEGDLVHIYDTIYNQLNYSFYDLDNDGDLDMLRGQTVLCSYYRNDGTVHKPYWTLADPNPFDLVSTDTQNQTFPEIGDLNLDGLPDVLIGVHAGNIRYYKNTGSKEKAIWSLASVDILPPVAPENMFRDVIPALADMDNDGDLDLFTGGNPTDGIGRIRYYENTGLTGDIPNYVLRSDDVTGHHSALAYPVPEDVDGDGDIDLIQCKGDWFNFEDNVLYFENTGSPESHVWAAADTEKFSFVNTPFYSPRMTFADYDHDGDKDVVACNYYGNTQFFKKTNSGYVQDQNFISNLFRKSSFFDFGDLDGDGDHDLIFTEDDGFGYDSILWKENLGNARIPMWSETRILAPLDFSEHRIQRTIPELVDIDHDNDLDLFVGYCLYIDSVWTCTGNIAFYENVNNEFVLRDSQYMTFSEKKICDPNFTDIDNDGDEDLFVANSSQNAIVREFTFFRNNAGPGVIPDKNLDWEENPPSLPMPFPSQNGYFFSSLGDIDSDGDFDIFFSRWDGGEGNVEFVENTGTPGTPSWASGVTDYQGWEFYAGNCYLVVHDMDGDGGADFLISDNGGGFRYYRNDVPKVYLTPSSKTVASGESLILDCPEESSISSWHFIKNRSGATILPSGTSAEYIAGSNTGVSDVIEVVNASGAKGRAHINVISQEDITKAGKAVIMAGRKSNDSLWTKTNVLAHYIYNTLLYRGFSKDNIHYLNPDTNQDADGNNNYADDIDAASSLVNFEDSLSLFAPGSPRLLVYLIDHGDADDNGENGVFRCNESDLLYASHLDSMLDDLQENEGVTTLTLVVDCCHAGAFLKECSGAPSGKTRIVISSSSSIQASYYTAEGLISFTSNFVSAIYSGQTLGEAFNLAAGSMDRYQQPQLDDNGDGVYDKDSDGGVAEDYEVGAYFIAGSDRPQAGVVSPNQKLTGGVSDAEIWASEISATYPLLRVWATIAPPEFFPLASINPGEPVQNLPEMELEWNEVNNRYEATTDTFTQTGTYTVNIYAEDIWGGVSFPKQTYINQVETEEKMIIVCGDGNYDSDSLWSFSDYLANLAYETSLARWFDDDTITYLSSSGSPGVDGAPSKSSLLSAISSSSGMDKVTLYLVGGGDGLAFDIDGDGWDADDVTPSELDAALDSLQLSENVTVIVILEFHNSGAWLSRLMPPPDKSRIVITSCSENEDSMCEAGGAGSFSQFFFSRIFTGRNIRDAFIWARAAVRGLTDYNQNPQLDDDGSGVADGWDGALASMSFIGAAYVTGVDVPVITDFAGNETLSDNNETLWASGVWDSDGISKVYAYLVKHDDDSVRESVKVDLSFNNSTSRWEAGYSGFDPSKNHSIIYFAEDKTGVVSEPYQALFEGSHNLDLYDIFHEDDYSTTTLNFFSDNSYTQVHNFWEAGDVDWAMFNADAGRLYTIMVSNQAPHCDAQISLYHETDLDNPHIPVIDDYHQPGSADEIMVWNSGTTSGTMYVKVTQSPVYSCRAGNATTYTLSITGDWGPNTGLATITGVDAMIGPPGGTLVVGDDGIYTKTRLTILPGALEETVKFRIEAPGDTGNRAKFEPTVEWLKEHPTNASIVRVWAESYVEFNIPATLTLQFIDDGPTTHGFTIDDVGPGESVEDMWAWFWSYGENKWVKTPGPVQVNEDTVTIIINNLGKDIFGVAHKESIVDDWMMY